MECGGLVYPEPRRAAAFTVRFLSLQAQNKGLGCAQSVLLPLRTTRTGSLARNTSLPINNHAVQCGRSIPIACKVGGSSLMFLDSRLGSVHVANKIRLLAVVLALLISAIAVSAQEPDITKKLDGFDSYMAQILKDWNTPGIGVGIVVNDKLVFAKGYGYRD